MSIDPTPMEPTPMPVPQEAHNMLDLQADFDLIASVNTTVQQHVSQFAGYDRRSVVRSLEFLAEFWQMRHDENL